MIRQASTTRNVVITGVGMVTPLGRSAGWPEEAAKLVAFIASDRSICVNGQAITVDGGI